MSRREKAAERLVERLARDHTELAIRTLSDICGDPKQPAPARVSAAQHLLDRGWGKPRQDFTIDNVGDLSGLSDDDIAAELAALADAAAAAEGGAEPPPATRTIN